jgi:hypothetical protein
MASANSSTTTIPSTLSVQINEKLTKSNFILWKAQIDVNTCHETCTVRRTHVYVRDFFQ